MTPQSYWLGIIATMALIAGQWWLALLAALMVFYFGFLAMNEPDKQTD
jgi:hypothetical protein